MKYIMLLLSLVLLLGCTQTTQSSATKNDTNATMTNIKNTSGQEVKPMLVKSGDTVSVDYIGSLEDGTIFDTSIKAEAEKAGLPPRERYEPLQFKVGAGKMIQGFDNGVIDMKVGEEKTVLIPEDEAYGPYLDNLVVIFANDEKLKGAQVGMHIRTDSGSVGFITQINATNVTVDFNHPLAGKTLKFTITLRKIN